MYIINTGRILNLPFPLAYKRKNSNSNQAFISSSACALYSNCPFTPFCGIFHFTLYIWKPSLAMSSPLTNGILARDPKKPKTDSQNSSQKLNKDQQVNCSWKKTFRFSCGLWPSICTLDILNFLRKEPSSPRYLQRTWHTCGVQWVVIKDTWVNSTKRQWAQSCSPAPLLWPACATRWLFMHYLLHRPSSAPRAILWAATSPTLIIPQTRNSVQC